MRKIIRVWLALIKRTGYYSCNISLTTCTSSRIPGRLFKKATSKTAPNADGAAVLPTFSAWALSSALGLNEGMAATRAHWLK